MALILFGYYGFDNVGDEQLLDETVRLIQEMPTPFPFIVANGPIPTPFPSFNRWNIVRWIQALIRSRVLVFGGGSVFQSRSSLRSLLFYLFIVQLAQWCQCRVIVLCHGWGPFKYAWHERLSAWVLRHADRSWRCSMQYPRFVKDAVFCDLTLTQPPVPNRDGSSNKVGVSFRLDGDESHVSSHLLKTYSSVIRLTNETKPRSNGVSLSDIWEDHDLSLSLVVTDRYHTAIWASKHGIAWVGISTDPKLINLAQSASQLCYASVSEYKNAMDLTDNSKGVCLQAWVSGHAPYRLKIKDWLHEHITH